MPATMKSTFRCQECAWTSAKWVGRCPGCNAWGTVQAEAVAANPRLVAPPQEPARPIAQVDRSVAVPMPTGVAEFDRVLGGGLVPGAVVLLAGEPGVGKSTLLLGVLAGLAAKGERVLYLSGEESAGQVGARARRVGAQQPLLYLAQEQDVAGVAGHVEQVRPRVVVIDSIQTMRVGNADGLPGGVSQVRASAAALIDLAKAHAMACLLVGHVTKDGSIAGPRTLEHLVDVVLSFEGERGSALRMVRAVKNRFGPTEEVGCFEMDESGVTELADPSALFRTGLAAPGSCLTVALEGRRALVAEVQALVVPASGGVTRRTTVGMDSARMAVVQAVVERGLNLPLSRSETYFSSVGGLVLREPAADLAAALAVAGSFRDRALPEGWLAFGEVGLSGDLRMVPGLGTRLAEADRLGFTDAVVPAIAAGRRGPKLPAGLAVHQARSLRQAVSLVPWTAPAAAEGQAFPGRSAPHRGPAGDPDHGDRPSAGELEALLAG